MPDSQPTLMTRPMPWGGLQWREAGQGAPLVLLPGFMNSSFCFRRVMPLLARHYRVFALDLPGILGSAHLPGWHHDPQSVAAALEQWAGGSAGGNTSSGSLAQVTVVGVSWAGSFALAWARLAPQRVSKVVIAGGVSSFFHPSFRQSLLLRPWVLPWMVPVSARSPLWLRRHFLAQVWTDTHQLTKDVMKGYVASLRGRTAWRTAMAYARQYRREWLALRQQLSEIHQPVLALWGELDRVVPPQSGRQLAAALPNARFKLLPGTGHLMFEEQPALFAAEIERFVGGG